MNTYQLCGRCDDILLFNKAVLRLCASTHLLFPLFFLVAKFTVHISRDDGIPNGLCAKEPGTPHVRHGTAGI